MSEYEKPYWYLVITHGERDYDYIVTAMSLSKAQEKLPSLPVKSQILQVTWRMLSERMDIVVPNWHSVDDYVRGDIFLKTKGKPCFLIV